MDTIHTIINILTFAMQDNSHQVIANQLENLFTTEKHMNDLVKANIVIPRRKWFTSLEAYLTSRSNLVIVNGIKEPLRKTKELFLKPFYNNLSSVETYIQSFVTSRFLLFIQGISLFREDGNDVIGSQLGRPAYHRSASCGPKKASKEYKQANMSCLNVTDADELRRRMRNIWNCYLERLVYTDMFEKYFGEQDWGHRLQGVHVERELFESCFPVLKISIGSVQITKWDQNTPITLQIVYKKQIDALDMSYEIVTETYQRTLEDDLYDLNVYCQRHVAYPNGQNRVWTKVCSFYNKSTQNWIAQTTAPVFDDKLWKNKGIQYKSKLVLTW